MKILKNKNLTQKIIIAIVIMISFNFVAPTYSRADFGGVLLGPIIDFIASIGDAVMALLQYFMDGNIELSIDGFLKKATGFNAATYGMEVKPELENITIDAGELDQGWFGWSTYSIPIIKYSPERIFANEVPALDANFINPKTGIDEDGDGVIEPGEEWSDDQRDKSIAIQLQETISSWYNALRNLVIVLLLSILLYVGIRMMLTSISSDKAKYKQMLMDWIVALCLLFFLHYIMSFTMTFVEIITEGLSNATEVNIIVTDPEIDPDPSFRTNLTGYCRMQVQYADLGKRLIYLIFYIALVVYTFMFTWKYMKRAITLAFLTLMAPLVTLTYPIDKIGDGKAQAFNMWLKEYIFNALLQPFHLIIYSIFLGGSMHIAIENPLYAILFLAFITPAEKILRKFFKFDQATTADASFAKGLGGAAAFNAIKGLVNKGAKGLSQGRGGNGGNGGNGNIRQQTPVESQDSPDGYSAFANSANTALASAEDAALANSTNAREGTPSRLSEEEIAEREALRNQLDNADYNDMYLNPELYQEQQDRLAELDRKENGETNPTQQEQIREQQPNTAQQTEQQQTRGNRLVRGITGAITGAGRYTGERLRSRFATKEGWARTGRFLGKAAVRTVTTGVGAAVGIGMGIAGDDLEDVFKYGAAGTALGATALNDMVLGAGSRIANSGIVQAVSRGAREGYHGSVNAADIQRQTTQLRNSGELREYIGNNITHEDGSRLSMGELSEYEDRGIEHYNAGITDFSAIKKTLKLEDSIKSDLASNTGMTDEQKAQMARSQAQTIANIADDINADKLATDAKYRQGRREDFQRGLLKANPNMSQSEVKQSTEQMMKLLCKYKKVNYTKD